MRAQPVIRSVLTPPSYVDLPCDYLFCKIDKVFPILVQERMVKTATDQRSNVKTYDCLSGHSPFLSWKGGLVDSVHDFVGHL